MKLEIKELKEIFPYFPDLITLLQDAVEHGASLGYFHPLPKDVAEHYWHEIQAEINLDHCTFLAGFCGEKLTTSVQLAFANQPNASHRVEIQNLLVHSKHRRAGYGRAMMEAAEAYTQDLGKSLLVLDSRKGDPASALFKSMGYQLAGKIPYYSQSTPGVAHASSFFYKVLE